MTRIFHMTLITSKNTHNATAGTVKTITKRKSQENFSKNKQNQKSNIKDGISWAE